MSVSRFVSIPWRVNYIIVSAWRRLLRRSGCWLMPQIGRSAFTIGWRIQDTFVSYLAILLWGTSPSASAFSNWCPCWQPACRACIPSPSPTGPWLAGPPSAQIPPLSLAVCLVLQSCPKLPSCSSQRYLVWWGGRCTCVLASGTCGPGLRPCHRARYVGLWWGRPSCSWGRGWLWNPPAAVAMVW